LRAYFDYIKYGFLVVTDEGGIICGVTIVFGELDSFYIVGTLNVAEGKTHLGPFLFMV